MPRDETRAAWYEDAKVTSIVIRPENTDRISFATKIGFLSSGPTCISAGPDGGGESASEIAPSNGSETPYLRTVAGMRPYRPRRLSILSVSSPLHSGMNSMTYSPFPNIFSPSRE